MPDSNIIQIDQNLFETKLDRLVTEKMTQILNAMLDAEADEITGAARYERKEGARRTGPATTNARSRQRRAGSSSGCRNSRARSSNPRSSNATAGGSPASRRR